MGVSTFSITYIDLLTNLSLMALDFCSSEVLLHEGENYPSVDLAGPNSIKLEAKLPLVTWGSSCQEMNRIVLSDMIDPANQTEVGLLLYSRDRKEHRCHQGYCIKFKNYLVQCQKLMKFYSNSIQIGSTRNF